MLTEDEEVTASSCTISMITTLTFTVLVVASRKGYKQLEDTGLSFPSGQILQGSTAKGDNEITASQLCLPLISNFILTEERAGTSSAGFIPVVIISNQKKANLHHLKLLLPPGRRKDQRTWSGKFSYRHNRSKRNFAQHQVIVIGMFSSKSLRRFPYVLLWYCFMQTYCLTFI